MKKINNICKNVLKLTQADLDEMEQIIQEQESYISPLKQAKQIRVNTLGSNNRKIFENLKSLRNSIINADPNT